MNGSPDFILKGATERLRMNSSPDIIVVKKCQQEGVADEECIRG